ncbi:MAG: hypothetical protein H0S85_11800 [Desulfovibrionaceae bacterium]|jgi:hypothetical protein|nr:hypothetical protein [Desulfovibrionaceae bacterium]
MNNTPYIFYSYSLSCVDVLLTTSEQWDLLLDNLGREIAYRKTSPTEQDRDTCIITPDKTTILNDSNGEVVDVLYFSIAKHIDSRKAIKYDKSADILSRESVAADEYLVGNIVMIPLLGLLAASDRSSQEDMNAKSSTNRFRAIVREIPLHSISIESAASYEYLREALKNWQLDEFSFTVRPFNPSVKTPGDKLHSLLSPDNAKVMGKEKPNKGDHLTFSEEGLMNEVTGLADRGYGEYGTVGTTVDGYHARIEKTAPESRKPPRIKVFVPPMSSKEAHVQAVAKTLLEIYGKTP